MMFLCLCFAFPNVLTCDINGKKQLDRTSILGDTIDYMKELLDRIKILQEEIQLGSNQLNVLSNCNNVKSNEIVVRNAPKVGVSGLIESPLHHMWMNWILIRIFCADDSAVWCGKKEYRYPDRRLLLLKARVIAIDTNYPWRSRPWSWAVCYKLFQWFWHASFLLWGK